MESGRTRNGSGQIPGDAIPLYLDNIQYEHVSYVNPIGRREALGGSIQYLGTGSIAGTDASGAPTGSFSSHYAAYTLAYGQAFTQKLSLGAGGEWIHASISNISANAFAGDLGGLYKVDAHWSLAATLMNAGSTLRFLDQGDALPLAIHVASAYQLPCLTASVEGVLPRAGPAEFHSGVEWTPHPDIALRAGYRTNTVSGLSVLSGMTLGIGITLYHQEFSYAWLPLGELGNTQYFSLVMHFGEPSKPRELIQYHAREQTTDPRVGSNDSDDQQLMQLLSNDGSRS